MAERDFSMLYTAEDINKAFNMGLESAIYVLERSLGLSRAGQRLMYESLKKNIEKNKNYNTSNSF